MKVRISVGEGDNKCVNLRVTATVDEGKSLCECQEESESKDM